MHGHKLMAGTVWKGGGVRKGPRLRGRCLFVCFCIWWLLFPHFLLTGCTHRYGICPRPWSGNRFRPNARNTNTQAFSPIHMYIYATICIHIHACSLWSCAVLYGCPCFFFFFLLGMRAFNFINSYRALLSQLFAERKRRSIPDSRST